MLIFFKENLVMFSVPKTGTTSYELALRHRADIILAGRRKHTNVSFYQRKLAPFLRSAYSLTPERMAVIRHPLEHMRSWYRYRSRDELEGQPNSTKGLSFDEFIEAALEDDPPPFAKVGSQQGFLIMAKGQVPVHHLFAYESQPKIRGFLEKRFQTELKLKQYNVSPDLPAPISAEIKARLHEKRAPEFALYEQVQAADGYLRQVLD
ncbi:sulfotransferase family 2 domain-containing protein [Alisedimentitalea sp. MJ-SS2]|uniref:sulfotransferase family 2 domain-containing protein n=1 Tax=Aliisedimentitalea sp. MJ-SS2 TaxID=3049795 RepID=UPI00290F93B9|nr:sulfotransferase family 2 domain-containing protein [Alisedimentitalea sp. MJ-SS2]MDU8929971.1 sulfotransferase family 2 domain-containing protein [Alisedimentitalea sp. MJ-SS2]